MRYALEYALLRGVLSIFAILPTEMASNIGGALFRTIGPVMGISRVAKRNLKASFPDWDDVRLSQTVKLMWDNLGRIVAEYPHLEDIACNRTTVLHPEKFKTGRGTMFIGGHIGNWEVLPPAMLFQLDIAMNPAYRAPNNPYVDALIVKYRGFGNRLRSFGKTRRGLADIMATLQNNESVGLLIDQKLNTGIEAAFFGRPAMTSTAFVELCRKLGCPLVPLRCVRLPGCRFTIEAFDPIEVNDRPTEKVVADAHTLLESWISEHPDQWLWLHRRWKDK